MLSISNLLCEHRAGNESLRYGHRAKDRLRGRIDPTEDPYNGAPRPVVVWAITQQCNLKCVHCYASATDQVAPNELSHEEGKALLRDLKSFGVPAVLFSGGEPLMRPDFMSLLSYARELDLRCTLSTNGMLITDEVAKGLSDNGLTYVGISLDGSPSRHDKLRGMQGAFDAAIEGVRACRRQGLKVGARFTVHALNHEDMDQVIDTCVSEGIERLCVYHLAYAGRGGKMSKVDLTASQTRDIIDELFEKTEKLHQQGVPLEVLTVGNHVDAAYLTMHIEKESPERSATIKERLLGTGGNRSGCNISSIDATGNVHYDQFSWHYNCGNIRESSFSEIWGRAENERLSILRDRQSHLPQRCQSCQYLKLCNGNLRTRAEAATGDWLGMDPSCYLTVAEVLGEAILV